MTRQQYEAQYGQSPELPTSNIDTTPSPIRMTRDEYEQRYKTTKQSFGEDTAQDRLQMGRDVDSALSAGKEDRERITARAVNGDENLGKETFRLFGSGLQTGAQVAGATIKGLVKMALPDKQEKTLKSFLTRYGDALSTQAQSDLESFRNGSAEEQNVAGLVDDFKFYYDTDETFRDDVNAAGGFTEALLSLGSSRAISEAGSVAADGVRKLDVSSVTPPVPKTGDQRLITNRSKTILGIEQANAATRKANEFERDNGAASRNRISQTDVLVGAVDSDGLLRTKQPGGAVDQYRKLTIDGVDDVVKRNLEREGVTISLPEIKRSLITAVSDSKLEGADLVTALKGVERELQGLAIRADSLNELPLTKLQDAKISTTRNINFNTPPETKTFRKAIARAYKDTIESKSSFNVGEVNKELAKYYKDIERLERLDGKRVKGGRAGKYFAQVSGNVVGGAAGSIGGGPGAALGALAGGELAGGLQGRVMASTFGKGGKQGVANPVLSAAAKEAKLPNGRSLEVPDQAISAPRSIEKTKDIIAVEKKIRSNIKQQKAAIKAKDYNLVAALKQVYDALKAQLVEMVDDIKRNGPSVGLSIKSTVTPQGVAKKMDAEDLSNVIDILDDPQGALLNDKLQDMLEAMGIGKADPDTQVRFLREVTDEVEKLSTTARTDNR